MKKWLLPICILLLFSSFSSKEAYLIYTGKGKSANFKKMMKAVEEADVVLFGEYHNNAISHWLELEVGMALFGEQPNMVMGCEMFEADDQKYVDAFLSDRIPLDTFMKKSRVWPNFRTDYLPILDFCKKNQIPMVATNVPRRYARTVSKGGFSGLDTLTVEEKLWMSPLPLEIDFDLPAYAAMIDMMKGHIGDLDPKNFVRAQALKDATMAYFIIKNKPVNAPFYHFNGSYHSDNYEGIVWWLQQKHPDWKIVTITTREYGDISDFQNDDKGAADFVVYVPETMTHTY